MFNRSNRGSPSDKNDERLTHSFGEKKAARIGLFVGVILGFLLMFRIFFGGPPINERLSGADLVVHVIIALVSPIYAGVLGGLVGLLFHWSVKHALKGPKKWEWPKEDRGAEKSTQFFGQEEGIKRKRGR
jgi:hypothetical protein